MESGTRSCVLEQKETEKEESGTGGRGEAVACNGIADGEGRYAKKAKLNPDSSHTFERETCSASRGEQSGFDRTINTAFACLEAVKELEEEALACMSKHKDDQRRSDEARTRVLQASNAVRRAEEAVKIAKKAQRKAESSFRMANDLTRVSKFASEEAQLRYSELQTQWEKDLETNLCRVLVQKNTVAFAYKELQETAGSLSLVPIKDMLDNACVTQLETLVKRVNACWLRLTIERRKFTETITNVKTTPQ